MKKFTLLFVCLMMFGIHIANAQQKTITGNVTSSDDGMGLPGVSVSVKGTTIGTITNADGKYSLAVGADAQALVFSFVGMITKEVVLGATNSIDVVMDPEVIGVDEVVVTALGISREKKSLGYAATSVSGADIADAKVVNPMSALQGKVAGIDISSAPGPGGTQNVMIRGASSFGSNQPLYIVDGVPIINEQVRGGSSLNNGVDFGSGINAINPDDIANMNVLRGAAATAIYGSRAANGVIIITTKKGKNSNGKMNVTYDGAVTINRIGRIAERQDQFGQGWSGDFALNENGNWGPLYTGEDRVYGYVVDNSQMIKPYEFVDSRIRDFYDLGVTWKNAVSLSGGNETTNYYVSYSNNTVDGVYPDDVDTYKRNTISTKGEHTWDKLKISSVVNFSNEKTKSVPSGQGTTVFRSLWEVSEDYSIVDMKDYNDKFWNLDNYFTNYGVNPYYSLYENGATQNKNKVYGKVQLDYEIISGLKATYRFGGDFENSTAENWQSKIYIEDNAPSYNASKISTGSYDIQKRTRYETNHEALLMYNKQFDKLSLNALAGLNVNERGYDRLGGELTALDVPGFYNLSNGTSDAVADQYTELRRLYGIYANVDLSYDKLVYMTLTARNDKSSTLPEANNSYFYPGITGSLAVSELLKRSGTDVNWLDFAKLRVAYGWTGNDADPYSIYPTYGSGEINNPGYPDVDDLTFPLNGVNSWMVSNQLGSPDLAPEITKEFEIGAEAYFYKNRLGVEFSYYNKLTEGLIGSQPLDPSSGYTVITSNIGDVRNKGIELLVFGTPIQKGDFKWNISVNYSQNRNKVESLAEGEVYLGGYGGMSIVAVEGEEMGLFKTQIAQTVEIDGIEYSVVDGAGIPVASADEVVLTDKSVNEKFRAGMTTSIEYKGFSLGGTLDLRYGGYIYSYTKDYMGWTGSGPETVDNDRNPFIIPNSVQLEDGEYVENTTPVASADLHTFYTDGGFEKAENFLLDRSYLKLREVRLSYEFPKSMAQKLKVGSIRLSLMAGNILLWTPEENPYIDPETTTFGNDISAKFGEFGAGPTEQTYTFGLSVTF